jgi:hypothetical protein
VGHDTEPARHRSIEPPRTGEMATGRLKGTNQVQRQTGPYARSSELLEGSKGYSRNEKAQLVLRIG